MLPGLRPGRVRDPLRAAVRHVLRQHRECSPQLGHLAAQHAVDHLVVGRSRFQLPSISARLGRDRSDAAPLQHADDLQEPRALALRRGQVGQQGDVALVDLLLAPEGLHGQRTLRYHVAAEAGGSASIRLRRDAAHVEVQQATAAAGRRMHRR
eukprot:1332010-Heterocapsa_arctica.AAC.1